MIPSVRQARELKINLIRFSHMYQGFIENKAKELANKMIVDPIRDEMERMGVHRKIWESVVVQSVKFDKISGIITIRIHSEYFAENGFDVALAREKGTEDHMIKPKGKINGGADVLSWIQGGNRRFSAGHVVSGLPRLNIIERTVEEMEYELQQKLYEEYERWKNSIFL